MERLKIKKLHTFNSCKKELKSKRLQNAFLYSRRTLTGIIIVDVCTSAGIKKYDYPQSFNFMYSYSHEVAFDCGVFVLTCAFYFCCWHGTYIVATFPVLPNVTRWMQINKNTNTNSLEGTSALSGQFRRL
jgi:hypothetical protein